MISEGHGQPSCDVQDIKLSTVTGAHFSKKDAQCLLQRCVVPQRYIPHYLNAWIRLTRLLVHFWTR